LISDRAQAWLGVKNEVIRRIAERIWLPGQLIPTETELAQEFGCARATVNKALRELAEAGLLDRRRKAGTRIAVNPVRKATLEIPITREEVQARGGLYRHLPLEQTQTVPPAPLARHLGLAKKTPMLHLKALHLSDENPFLYEDRWINLAAVPGIADVDFSEISANEWLVQNAPYTDGDISFSAANASCEEAEYLGTSEGTAIFTIDRATWDRDTPITSVRLAYAPGYRMRTRL
jgi:GntR family histidine utilization transcriptional repressor